MKKLNRKHAVLKKVIRESDSFVDDSPEERVLSVWDITKEIWFLQGEVDVKRRLQRDVVRLVKK